MKALLVVDIQRGLTEKKKLFKSSEFVEIVNNAIKRYRDQNDLIVFVQHNNKMLASGTEDWEIDKRLNRSKDDLCIQKEHGNAFKDTGLSEILLKNSIEEVLICGLVSHGCILRTCEGSLDKGFLTALLIGGHTNWQKDAEAKIVSTEAAMKKIGVDIVEI